MEDRVEEEEQAPLIPPVDPAMEPARRSTRSMGGPLLAGLSATIRRSRRARPY